TTVTLASSANPSTFGQGVTFTATISPVGTNSLTPTGVIVFNDGSTAPGPADLSGNTATLTLSTLSVGAHALTATYNGDLNLNTSVSSAFSQTVNKALTATTLTIAPNPALAGQPITFTATVTGAPAGAGTPTGSVTFVANGST